MKINPIPFKKRLHEVIRHTLTPPPKLALSVWADTYRVLSSEAAAEPGKWYTSRAEYQREILDTISDPSVETVVLMMGSQLGKSEALLNILGYFIHNDPSPIMLVQGSIDEARKFSTTRIAPLFRDTPVLRSLTAEAKSRYSANTILQKTFVGGSLTLVGANAPASLASKPIRVLLCDEIDRYPSSAGTEGNPVQLAIKRTTNFPTKKIILCSTPGDKLTSEIYARYLQTDQRVYQVKCIHCGHYFEPKFFEHVKWQKDEDGHYIKGSTLLYCPECGAGHTDAERNEAVRNGRWQVTNPEAEHAGFKTSQLVSPFIKLDALVRNEWLPAIGNPHSQRVFFNTVLSEPYEAKTEGIDGIQFLDRLESYTPTSIPNGALLLTAGIDVQKDRLECSVYGWGLDNECWHVEHVVINGSPTQTSTWVDLKTALQTKYRRADGLELPIAAAAIDSGHETRHVYAFTASNAQRRWYAIKGNPTATKVWPARASKTDKGKVYPLGIETAKDALAGWLKIEQQGPGYVHFPDSCTPEFFSQLTSERKVLETDKRGRTRHYWKCPQGIRNEVWDTLVYALAAKESLGNIRMRTLQRKQQDKLATPAEPQPKVLTAEVTTAPAAGLSNASQTPSQPAPNLVSIPAWKRKLLARKQSSSASR